MIMRTSSYPYGKAGMFKATDRGLRSTLAEVSWLVVSRDRTQTQVLFFFFLAQVLCSSPLSTVSGEFFLFRRFEQPHFFRLGGKEETEKQSHQFLSLLRRSHLPVHPGRWWPRMPGHCLDQKFLTWGQTWAQETPAWASERLQTSTLTGVCVRMTFRIYLLI